MKKMWMLHRAFHQDAADFLLSVFNGTQQIVLMLEKNLQDFPYDLNAQHWAQQLVINKCELSTIQDLTIWHMSEAHKYSALIAGTLETKLQDPAPASPSIS